MIRNLLSLIFPKRQKKPSNNSGYIQLIDVRTREIKQQRHGYPHHVQYYEENIWVVTPDLMVIFSKESDVYQPINSFIPVKKDEVIYFFRDYLDNVPPQNLLPTWTGTALELEQMEMSGNFLFKGGDTWSSFTQDGKWLGTSEY